ncbi:trimethylamine N-oxide reductase system protein TorE [Photobacterium swingsii]|uniref:Trimethylamine N-oxide reductase system protein TorE n=1 Tax=Photobacterium swingsii TaxID=680026 RepID=A0A0J8VFG7_9GAMM|nr:trimethylamine N-oxide reductase system protein TorE [Photobacterium swingsii]KMV32168.1 NapE protein [Photobacterium swingsii]PSW26958.1 trimethylamine N-oxide reductase system protein TorE [Photobacterium swingsii]
MSNQEPLKEEERGKYEWRSFIFITVFLFPILAIALVGGYGFIVWMLQVFFLGPPGHG